MSIAGAQSPAPLADQPSGYGLVTRTLHWGMALLFAWQFTSAILRAVAEDTAIEGFFWSTHYSVGFTLWVLVLLRGAWGLANWSRRPPHEGPPLLARAATLGHLALYALMVVVPTLAILRAAGNGRGFRVYGIQLVAPGGEPVPALVAPGNALHGFLGWTLLVLVAGHIAMALWHGLVRRDATLSRMTRGREPQAIR
ncbi:cytochrome b [Aureimonas jatrophae]|uniref:Cytochrome b561 n=1 Tax=Aureimonas jatrophae TaxID=1166073 RepID=A0A1H0D7D5_9HYPH|nr:cytochrome b [Aureimonas jatrophae]MBB3951744.1 cytochrome b561 [Aureimonas jatrophae]SDN66107.1 cytochrome b561 [Aureimonas jatrophae]